MSVLGGSARKGKKGQNCPDLSCPFLVASPENALISMPRLILILALLPSLIAAQTADERLRALYTSEWNWRQREMARRSDAPGDAGADDHFPRVDAATQERRRAYWLRALATLDSIPFTQLSPEEQIN